MPDEVAAGRIGGLSEALHCRVVESGSGLEVKVKSGFMRWFVLVLSAAVPHLAAEPLKASLCHAFVDYDFILTLEVVRSKATVTPIFNMVSLAAGEWELQPGQFKVVDSQGKPVPVENFSFDTGDPNNPQRAPYLKLRGGDSAGFDLVGPFSTVDAISRVSLDLGKERLVLEPMDCDAFEDLLDRVSRLDFGSGNVMGAFQTLNLQLMGEREVP